LHPAFTLALTFSSLSFSASPCGVAFRTSQKKSACASFFFAFRKVGFAVNVTFACALALFSALVSKALYPYLLMQTYDNNNT